MVVLVAQAEKVKEEEGGMAQGKVAEVEAAVMALGQKVAAMVSETPEAADRGAAAATVRATLAMVVAAAMDQATQVVPLGVVTGRGSKERAEVAAKDPVRTVGVQATVGAALA
mmetsp:Transcript_110206/g.152483  ORF Transcript_110206/g.152483 Transcript_110206/m.152483 type:complete len:113 (-) Transcript_110206:146-484(-)